MFLIFSDMASAKTPHLILPKQEELIHCGICKEVISKPKALQCLHTFCLDCLKEWSKSSQYSVTCPKLTCQKTTPMPPGGIEGLPGNVFVSSLIETR